MITQIFGSTGDFPKAWNNSVYFQLRKIACGFKDQVRVRSSGHNWEPIDQTRKECE
jgi:hypothetical protein